jgi:ribosomal protein S18 acetylase RimI-like enzyme
MRVAQIMPHIRPAEPGDAEALSRLHAAAWRETYAGLLPPDFLSGLDRAGWMSAASWNTRITRQAPWRGVFVVEQDGALVGFSGCRILETGPDGYRGEIAQIYLLQRAQRQGLGAHLMRKAAGLLAAEGLAPFLLWVLIDNAPAHGFYRRLGGTPLGRQKLTLGGKEVEEMAYGWAGPEALFTPSRHPPAA